MICEGTHASLAVLALVCLAQADHIKVEDSTGVSAT